MSFTNILLLDCKEIKPVDLKGNQPQIFIGRTDAEAEAPTLWTSDAKNQLSGKDPDAGKDWRQEEKGTTRDEVVGWHHWFNGHKFEQTPRDGKEQGSLVLQSMGLQRGGHDWATEQLLNERDPVQKDADYRMISSVESSGKAKMKLQF